MITAVPLRYDVYVMPTRTGRAYNSKEPTPGTLGIFALLSKLGRSVQKTCRVCGHPIAFHSIIDGRFKD